MNRSPLPNQYAAIHTCLDRHLPGEAPANALVAGGTAAQPATTRAALARNKIWQPVGRTLRVHFLDGEAAMQQQVIRFAQLWSHHANLTFAFDTAPTVGSRSNARTEHKAEIRISFARPGSWSYIGTDALAVPTDEPTMNFGWLTPSTPTDEVMRVVLHEFGHAIGLIHEHQNPATTIPWNREAVYAYYSGPPNNWTREEVDHNLFQLYDRNCTQFSAFDRQSIMLYPIPQEFTDGDFTVGWNQCLSAVDKAFVAACYPFPDQGERQRAVLLPQAFAYG
jgi:hypothetical protein